MVLTYILMTRGHAVVVVISGPNVMGIVFMMGIHLVVPDIPAGTR
jgi:hypothetical protein